MSNLPNTSGVQLSVLGQPQAGQRLVVPAQPGLRFALDFQLGNATVDRSEDNLIFTFADGSSIEIENFYIEYAKDNIPDFQVDGQLIPGTEFFAAFAPDIEPAAGVGVSARGGRYSNFADSDLMNGVGRLGNLDESFNVNNPGQVAALEPVALNAAARGQRNEGGLSAEPPLTPSPPPPPPLEPPPPPPPPPSGVNYGHGYQTDVTHRDPLYTAYRGEYGWDIPQFRTKAKPDYDATVSAPLLATGASGKAATNSLHRPGDAGSDVWDMKSGENTGRTGDDVILNHRGENVTVKINVNSPPTVTDTDHTSIASARTSGLYAMNSGTLSLSGDRLTVEARAGGLARGGTQSAVITGLRADGTTYESNEYGDQFVDKNSQINLDGAEVNVRAVITGNANTQDYSRSTYAAVAATEHGHVDIGSAGDINISTASAAEGGALKASGVHGIFSGHGLDLKDLGDPPPRQDDSHDFYHKQLTLQYLDGRFSEGRFYGPENQHKQTEVNVRADGDVNVAVGLARADGEIVSGVTAIYGDVNVKAGGDVNVSVSLGGKHDGGGNVSAVTIRDSILSMEAEGGINLSLSGSGHNLSTISTGGHDPYTNLISFQKRIPASRFSAGEEINITGRAGENGASHDNSIAGIQMNVNPMSAGVILKAGERVSVDVAARDNGGRTEAVGIQHDRSSLDSYRAGFSSVGLGVGVDASEFVIKAAIKDGSTGGDSRAAGISARNGGVYLANSWSSPDDGSYYDGNAAGIWTNSRWVDSSRSIESARIDVSGGRQNAGMEAIAADKTDAGGDPYYYGYRYADVQINVRELDIDVRGGTMSGHTASYGINAEYYTDEPPSDATCVGIHTDNLNVTVADADRAVGLRAGGYAEISIESTYSDDYYNKHALSVAITCDLDDLGNLGARLRGLAVEAVNGGHVGISGGAGKDTVILNGHMLATGQREDISRGESYESSINIETGDGDDRIEIHGDITARDYGKIWIDAGDGDDIVSIKGKISNDEGGVYIRGGAGYDTLILTAPDAGAFRAWYQDWLTNDLDNLEFEKMVCNGIDPTDAGLAWLVTLLDDYAANNAGFSFQYNYNGNVYGGAYNDFLDSGADGAHHISGGDGNDVMVYHAGNTLDGGDGLDALLVSMTANPTASLEGLLSGAANTEVAIGINGEATWGNLAGMGISMGGDGLHLSGNGWSESTNGHYTTYTNGSGATVIVDNTLTTEIVLAATDILIKSA
ncbi:MAG: hypothetical protein LBC94_01865 [Desulfovibrio sp.]|jgi:hypothetical protein|nr:hypothetical protein [Desulfovibrio sp.]